MEEVNRSVRMYHTISVSFSNWNGILYLGDEFWRSVSHLLILGANGVARKPAAGAGPRIKYRPFESKILWCTKYNVSYFPIWTTGLWGRNTCSGIFQHFRRGREPALPSEKLCSPCASKQNILGPSSRHFSRGITLSYVALSLLHSCSMLVLWHQVQFLFDVLSCFVLLQSRDFSLHSSGAAFNEV